MSSHSSRLPVVTSTTIGAVLALAATAAACGSDDPAPELPEGGLRERIKQHDDPVRTRADEVLLGGGTGEMVVAVQCDSDLGGNLVTVVAEGLDPAVVHRRVRTRRPVST